MTPSVVSQTSRRALEHREILYTKTAIQRGAFTGFFSPSTTRGGTVLGWQRIYILIPLDVKMWPQGGVLGSMGIFTRVGFNIYLPVLFTIIPVVKVFTVLTQLL
jgi:hypothetical protein